MKRGTHGIKGLYIAGPIVWAVTYLSGIAVTAVVTGDEDRDSHTGLMAIPLAGPWLLMSWSTYNGEWDGPLIAAGALQASGFLMTILGVSIRREDRVIGRETPTLQLRDLAAGPVGTQGTGVTAAFTF